MLFGLTIKIKKKFLPYIGQSAYTTSTPWLFQNTYSSSGTTYIPTHWPASATAYSLPLYATSTGGRWNPHEEEDTNPRMYIVPTTGKQKGKRVYICQRFEFRRIY